MKSSSSVLVPACLSGIVTGRWRVRPGFPRGTWEPDNADNWAIFVADAAGAMTATDIARATNGV